MPRQPRLDFPFARHHVMNRGARRAPVFERSAVKRLFIDLLGDLPKRFGLKIHGYVVMDNHFHLMVETPKANLSHAMKHLQACFVQKLNAQHGWDGPVFRGRFRNRVASEDEYWSHLLAYLHLNPVRAGRCKHPNQGGFSSHQSYMKPQLCPAWLTTGELLDLHGGRSGLSQYIHEQLVGTATTPKHFQAQLLWNPNISGSLPAGVEPTFLAITRAVQQVAAVTGLPPEAVMSKPKGANGNPARWVAAWWLTRGHHFSVQQTAKWLRVHRTTALRLIQQAETRGRNDLLVNQWMRTLSHSDWSSGSHQAHEITL
jgi:REP element-mobilizing transposase RayT